MLFKSFLAIGFFLLFNSVLFAQPDSNNPAPAKCYTYDDAGNRTTRAIGSKSLTSNSDDSEDKNPKATDDTLESVNTDLIIVYPNPTYGELTIDFKAKLDADVVHCFLYDINGKLVFSEMLSSDMRQSIDISDIPAGEYLLEVSYNDMSTSWSIVKK